MDALAFLRVKCLGNELVIKDYKVKSEAAFAMGFAKTTSAKLLGILSDCVLRSGRSLGHLPFAVGATTMSEWLKCINGLLPKVGRVLLVKLLDQLGTLSLEVQKVTPRHENVLGEAHFSLPLAKKHLLNWPSRGLLSTKLKALFGGIADLQRMQTEWTLAPTLQDCPSTRDQVTSVNMIYENGKLSVTIIAAVNVIAELSGQNQKDSADRLLQSKRGILPAALIEQLEKLSK